METYTPITNRELPDGFQLDWDPDSWNVGHLFRWSAFYDCYLNEGARLTVKPGDTLQDAHRRAFGCEMELDFDIFFVVE